jgi:hypothetical protein
MRKIASLRPKKAPKDTTFLKKINFEHFLGPMTLRILYITNDSKTEDKLDQKVFKNPPAK